MVVEPGPEAGEARSPIGVGSGVYGLTLPGAGAANRVVDAPVVAGLIGTARVGAAFAGYRRGTVVNGDGHGQQRDEHREHGESLFHRRLLLNVEG